MYLYGTTGKLLTNYEATNADFSDNSVPYEIIGYYIKDVKELLKDTSIKNNSGHVKAIKRAFLYQP